MTALVVFAKAPVAGAAKRRLAATVGEREAQALYVAFLADTLAVCERAAVRARALWVAGDPDHEALRSLAPSLPRVRQPSGDLGARMTAALRWAIEAHGAGIVVGTDAPTLPSSRIDEAARRLEAGATDVVLGPAADGGYYLVGARADAAGLFDGVRWSTSFALADTARSARAAGKRVAFLPPWYDVDTERDLALLRAHLAVRPAAAPATASHLVGRAMD